MFFIIEKSEETPFEFAQNAATVAWFWLPIKMETQKIVNLLGDAQNLRQENGMLSTIKITQSMKEGNGEGNESGTTVVIIQTHILL